MILKRPAESLHDLLSVKSGELFTQHNVIDPQQEVTHYTS